MNAKIRLPDGRIVSLTDTEQSRLDSERLNIIQVEHGMDLDYNNMMRAQEGEIRPKHRTPNCGTHAGYKRHKRANEKACAACHTAYRTYRRAKYVAKDKFAQPPPSVNGHETYIHTNTWVSVSFILYETSDGTPVVVCECGRFKTGDIEHWPVRHAAQAKAHAYRETP